MPMADGIPRKAERVALQADISFRRSGERRCAGEILDVSESGCRLQLPERLVVGETVWITLPGLEPLQTVVRWVSEWTSGVEFARPLYPAVFDMVKKRLEQAR